MSANLYSLYEGLRFIKDQADIYQLAHNPKGNADTERVVRTLKEDLIWPYDRENPLIFKEH